jgi:hypothetical protein
MTEHTKVRIVLLVMLATAVAPFFIPGGRGCLLVGLRRATLRRHALPRPL